MKSILISRGLVTLVDDDVYEWASKLRWSAFPVKHTTYAYRKVGKRNQFLHRAILGASPGEEVDHIDGVGLNNLRGNLVITTHAGNAQGFQTPRREKTSIYRGVRWHARDNKWTAQIKVNGQNKFLGYHLVEVSAAAAYNRAALQFFGARASLNSL